MGTNVNLIGADLRGAPGRSAPAEPRHLATLAILALPLALSAAALRPAMQAPWPRDAFLGVHLVIELLVAVVAFGTFAVQWYAAGAKLGDARARLIGAAFLAVGAFKVVHLLAFPGMPGIPGLAASTERGIVYWFGGRFSTVGALLVALRVAPGSDARLLRRGPLLGLALGLVAAVLVADYTWISREPRFFVEGLGLTPLKRALELVLMAGAAVGAVAWRREDRRHGDPYACDLVLALGVTVLAELCFALYARAYDSFNLLGHAYLLIASAWIFRALFADAVLRPHERLAASTAALEVSNAELRRLRAHVEGELEVTIRSLRALQAQREDLLRAVSHDLRTPLQVVMLQADRLSRIAPPGTRERGAAESMARAGRQMNALISDLVDSVYLEHGALHLAKEPLALRAFVGELLGAESGVAGAERFRVEIPAALPTVQGDAARLTRVIHNLAGNALKYSALGTEVLVGGRQEGRAVVLTFADRGAGIAPEDLPRIFDRFYRGGRQGKTEGLGLGLYISRLIVAAHGGRIWCESTPGEGSTFSFSLPLDESPAEPAAGGS